MRGAFVVQLWKITDRSSQFEGIVEEIDTGMQAKFLSENELIEFLRGDFRHKQQSEKHKKGMNDANNDCR